MARLKRHPPSGRCVHWLADRGITSPEALGAKGAALHEMAALGLPVPPGFTISTDVCAEYHRAGRKITDGLWEEIKASLRRLEQATAKRLGDPASPLLLSVRCGSATPVRGLMPTVLNLGMNEQVANALALRSGDEQFAHETHCRAISGFAAGVMWVDSRLFERELTDATSRPSEREPAGELQDLARRYGEIYREQTQSDWLAPAEQLKLAIAAAFDSWNSALAVALRRKAGLENAPGLAVTVQAMVFGNLGKRSGTGAAFTRNPNTGQNEFFGEYLPNAQGTDLVGGGQTPEPISRLKKDQPGAYRELLKFKRLLESHYKDAQDLEFTIERGRLYILQTRTAKRSAAAGIRMAVEMARQGLIDHKTALLRVDPGGLDQLLHPRFDANGPKMLLASGLPASPGAAVGRIAFSAEEAECRALAGEEIILVRPETDASDVGGMQFCQGILTSTGGMTSHAAVVARGMGTPCVVGAGDLLIDEVGKTLTVGDKVLRAGEFISIDGGNGQVYQGQVPTAEPELSASAKTLLAWADRHRTLGVRANADTPDDAELARGFGAEGVGLCRTEHMFFGSPQRLMAMRRMILASDVAGREAALKELLPYQQEDFVGLFTAMAGLPVTIRLLDPPLHEFLPHNPKDQEALAQSMGIEAEQVRRRVEQLHETNPMLGHRGCRLAVTYPEILVMQVRTIIAAAAECKRRGIVVRPEIMTPLVMAGEELRLLNRLIDAAAADAMREAGVKIRYTKGTMIEVPRAALIAKELAGESQFFSFGTNDLTQLTLGFSRDDAGSFLPKYLEKKLLERDPFQGLDRAGVGMLVQLAAEQGRLANPHLKCGVCGEHGGDPQSIEFFHQLGLDYVSCSPYRVPIARLAAAQAAIRHLPQSPPRLNPSSTGAKG